MSIQTPWFDQFDAIEQTATRAGTNSTLQKIGVDIVKNGFTVLPNLISHELCDSAVEDFHQYTAALGSSAGKYKDQDGKFYRLVNFHLTSKNALAIGSNPTIMLALDYLFGMKAGIYTSLYFEYGTQQPIHRDSPFFETFPRNYFLGVWVALEDINPESGPLMYIPGGHRFDCDPHKIYHEVRQENPDLPASELIRQSLELYYGEVIDRAYKIATPVTVPLRKGDVAIWHPSAPHGGSPAVNPNLSRRSMVFHCAPDTLQVYQHDVFFSHDQSVPPPARYGFIEHEGRRVAASGDTAFQAP